MKVQGVQDERVLAQRRKINSEVCRILMIMLLGSILIQQFLLDAPFEQYAVEVICFFGISIYMIARFWMLGLNMHGEGKKSKNISLLYSIVAGITATTINGVLNYTTHIEHYQENVIGYFIAALLVTFISAMSLTFIMLSSTGYINNKRQEKVQKQLDSDEHDE